MGTFVENPGRYNAPLDVRSYFPLCPPPVPTHEEQVADILERSLHELGPVRVERLVVLTRPDLLAALWTTHKRRFLTEGRFERALRAQLVLEALRQAAPGSLAVARATAGDAVFVAWIDLARNALVSVLEDDEGLFGPAEGADAINA
jgi:hypothetical protein